MIIAKTEKRRKKKIPVKSTVTNQNNESRQNSNVQSLTNTCVSVTHICVQLSSQECCST